jgi:hypothetical protein
MKSLVALLLLAAVSTQPVLAGDAERLALAREVIKSTRADRMLDGITTHMKQMSSQAIGLSGEKLTPEQRVAAEKIQGEIMEVTMQAAKEMLAKMDALYAEVYTEAELKAMVAFFESPEGRSMIEKQPLLMQKSMPLMQEMQRTLMPKIQEITAKAKAEGTGAAPAATPGEQRFIRDAKTKAEGADAAPAEPKGDVKK